MKQNQLVFGKKGTKNKQEKNNVQETVVHSSGGTTHDAPYDESIELATQFKFKVNVSPDLQSNNEIIAPYGDTVLNETGVHAASSSLATNTDAPQTNDVALTSTDIASMLRVPLNSKSGVKNDRRSSTNKKRKDSNITLIKGKQNTQDPVQINTINRTRIKNKENKMEATGTNKSSMENILNGYEQHEKNSTKKINSDITRKTKKRKSSSKTDLVFLDHIPVSQMKKILQEQSSDNVQYIKGNLRVNSVSCKYAYLSMGDTEERDLLIVGTQDRNRAFDGDLVVANINPEDVWKKFPDGKIQKTGTIVCILETLHPRKAIGHLKKEKSLMICHPRDHRIPMINIQLDSIPPQYLEQPDLYKNVMFYVDIDSWEQLSYASGRIFSIVGESGEIEAEMQMILLENNLDISPYRKELLEGLPDSDALTEDDIKGREDWRNECIFSIDPATAVDIDDLLSCKILENGNYEVGVHISDVTHYLKFSTLLDLEVSKRATSIYVPHMVYHMLPEQLCQICSLHAGKDRLAFSVIWEMTPDAEVVRHRFAKTVVRSCYQMSYDLAQIMIDNPEKSWPEDFLDIKGDYTASMLCDTVNRLFKLSSKMRSKRLDNGALRLDQPKLQISFDRTLNREGKIPIPVNYYVYENKASHSLVEEFMLLANTTTAIRLHAAIPESAFLRIHKDPSAYSLNLLRETLRSYGICINLETAGALHASIHRYESDCYSDSINSSMKYIIMVIINLCSKSMTRAAYVCASTISSSHDITHYALNVPFYTHFTSPIRRYADCAVHRLLSAVIENKPLPEEWTAQLCSRIATNCNVKKYNAKLAQDQSTEVFFAEMVGLAGGFEALAIVLHLNEGNINIILCDTGVKLKVELKEIAHTATIIYTVDYAVPNITVHWKQRPMKQVISMFSFVRVRVEKIDKMLRLKATLLPSK